jgi:hypothetical protein
MPLSQEGVTSQSTNSSNSESPIDLVSLSGDVQSSSSSFPRIKLGDYPHITRRLKIYQDTSNLALHLHLLLYQNYGNKQSGIRQEILAFAGFDDNMDLYEYIQTVERQKSTWPRGLMSEILYVLGCSGVTRSRFEMIERIIYFLASPQILKENRFCVLPLTTAPPLIRDKVSMATSNTEATSKHRIGSTWSGFHYYLQHERKSVLPHDSFSDQEINQRLNQRWMNYSDDMKEVRT